MNKNSGFTLVELLAIVAILGIIVMLVFPGVGESIDSKKEKELSKIIDIIENAGKAYFSFNDDTYKVNVSTLTEEKFLTKELINPSTNEKIEGCVRKTLNDEKIFTYTYGSCNPIEVPFSVVLNGGTPLQEFNSTYDDSTKIILLDPTHPSADFKGWQIVKGNSIIKGNTLIIGTTETELYANFEHYPKLIVDLDLGNDNIDYNETYKTGTIIELEVPNRKNYTFKGWEIESGNSIVSGNNLIMGSTDTKVKAKWELLGVGYVENLLEDEELLNNGLIHTNVQYNGTTYDAGIRYSGKIDQVKNKVYYNCDAVDRNGKKYGDDGYEYSLSCEIWRIIGVFDTKISENSEVTKRIKLVNSSSVFKSSFDSSITTVNRGWGINQWGESGSYEGADIKQLLNGYYINKDGSKCIYCDNYHQETCEIVCDTNEKTLKSQNMKPLTDIALDMIENAVWDTYAVMCPSNDDVSFNFASTAYLQEKGISAQYTGKSLCENTNGEICNDKITRTTKWIGLVGLPAVSDIIYGNGWLYNPTGQELYPWTIIPRATPDNACSVWRVDDGRVYVNGANQYRTIFPTVYLKSNIKFKSGNGDTEPYILY